jgi:predicted DNA-binding transcriptional regulator AlpA
MPRYDALPTSLPPRGLSREAAAQYVGISTVNFDEMVEDGRMPKPKRIDSRKVWDRRALDLAFDALTDEAGSGGVGRGSWDDYLNGAR